MTTSSQQRPARGLGITALVLALLAPPVGFLLGFLAGKRGSTLGYVAVFVGGIATVFGLIIGFTLLSTATEEGYDPAPTRGFVIALVVLAVVATVGSLVWRSVSQRRSAQR